MNRLQQMVLLYLTVHNDTWFPPPNPEVGHLIEQGLIQPVKVLRKLGYHTFTYDMVTLTEAGERAVDEILAESPCWICGGEDEEE